MNNRNQLSDLSHFLNQLLQASQSSELPIKVKITIGACRCSSTKSRSEKQIPSPDLPAESLLGVYAMPEQLLSTEQAASILDVSKDTLNKYREQGWLRGLNLNKHDKQLRAVWKYRRSELEEFISSLEDR